jgi:hypothetical protein
MDSNDSNDSNNTNGGTLSLPFILFILNIVVISNTSRDTFKTLGYTLYYDFELFNLIIIAVISLYGIGYCVVGVTVPFTVPTIQDVMICLGIIMTSWIIGTLYYMGSIWHEDPKHSILFYEEYWKESVMDFSCFNSTQLNATLQPYLRNGNTCPLYDKKWAYIMSDVIIRIYSFFLIMIFSIILPIICCGCICFKMLSICKSTDIDTTIIPNN